MSTLVSAIIQQAFREGNFVAVGEAPTVEEIAEAVPKLNAFIASLFGIEIGAQFREWYVPAIADPASPLRYPPTPTGINEPSTAPWAYPPANSRLLLSITSAATLYLPSRPSDGARLALVDVGSTADVTLDGNGRKIAGGASLIAAPDTLNGSTWFYRSDLGDWVLLDPVLAEDDPVPLPPEFDDLLVCGLATRLAPRFGVEISATTAQCYADMLERLKKRYRQSEQMPATVDTRFTLVSDL